MSVSIPLMAPFEYGVLWFDMCSASASRSMVSSITGKANHLPNAADFGFVFFRKMYRIIINISEK